MFVCACVLSVRFTSCIAFFNILNELNDYAGQREVVAEEMGHRVYAELMRYSHDLKTERKMVIFVFLNLKIGYQNVCLLMNWCIRLPILMNMAIHRFCTAFITHICSII